MSSEKADLSKMKGISAEDVKMIKDAEVMLGPEPEDMGHIKNLFWGRVRKDLVFPYPVCLKDETAECDALIVKLEHYLKNEHPSIQIDQDQEIPEWVFKKLFELGIMGLTIPKEYGGLGLGITSYNRVLEMIGRYCGSTSVIISAHMSIGCKAVMLFGTEEQKKKWLPMLATKYLSAFCLSEPNVGCDAGGQETYCELSSDGSHYILNGEKKWTTSGFYSKLFTVMAKQKIKDSNGKEVERVTALVCTPDMSGIDIFQKNRSKCGIRGTWQARVRFKDVKVPKENLLHKEGKGLNVALTCLNFGRCTLSAGMLGGAMRAMDQGVKWATTRFQFGRPLSDFELMRKLIAEMSAYTYAMNAMLYMTTGMMDRHDKDIMVETATCKVFCSELGWRTINNAVQIMGGEGYMTENEIERIFRDARIYLIVEGANEVMQSYIFGYGGKQLAEYLLGLQNAVSWESGKSLGQNVGKILKNSFKPRIVINGIKEFIEVVLEFKRTPPQLTGLHPDLTTWSERVCELIRDHSYYFKRVSFIHKEKIVTRQVAQSRVADVAIWLHGMLCVLSKLDHDLSQQDFKGEKSEQSKSAAMHFLRLAELEIERLFIADESHSDETMRTAAEKAIAYNNSLSNKDFIIPERSPNAKGTGKIPDQTYIKQFPGDSK